MMIPFSTRFSDHKKSSDSKTGFADQTEDLKGFKDEVLQTRQPIFSKRQVDDQNNFSNLSQGKSLPIHKSSFSQTKLQNPEEGRKDFKDRSFYPKKSSFAKNRSEYSSHIPEGSNGSRGATLSIRQPSFLKERSENKNGFAKEFRGKLLSSPKPSFAKSCSEGQKEISKGFKGKPRPIEKPLFTQKPSFAKFWSEEQNNFSKEGKRPSFQAKKSSFVKARSEEQDDLLKSSKGKPLPKRAKNLQSWKRQDFFLKDEESSNWENEGSCNASF